MSREKAPLSGATDKPLDGGRAITIKDLAALSGYSLGTVSRVLNHQPNVSDTARETIMAVAREHGFTLNLNAKHLKQSRSNNLLVVVRGVQNELFAMVVEQLQLLARDGPYQIVVDYIDELANEVAEASRRVREIKPQGIFFLGASADHFRARFGEISLPAVLVTNSAAELGFENLSSVTTDDEAAACAAVGRLLELGHRRVGVIGGDREQSDTSRLRYAGCVRAFEERGLTFDPAWYRTARYNFADGYEAMASLLREERSLTAVFAMSDAMAIGAARAIRDEGKTIPGDISLIGFDGLPICRYYQPRLATVLQDPRTMAVESYSILMAAIQKKGTAEHRRIPYRLEENGSLRSVE